MRVLGIDPGTRVLGYGVVEQQRNTLRALEHGTLSPGDSIPLAARLQLIFQEDRSFLRHIFAFFERNRAAIHAAGWRWA